MKMKSFLNASAIALGLALGSTTVLAQESASSQAPEVNAQRGDGAQRGAQAPRGEMRKQDRKAGDKRMRGHKNFGMIVPGFGPVTQEVVDSLNLSDAQKEKIAELKSKTQKNMKERSGSQDLPFATMLETRSQQLADGKLNPKEMVEQREKLRESMQERRNEYTEEWLAVWNDLNDEQQAKLATYFKEVEATRGQRFQRMKDKRDGSGRADAPGKGLKDGSGRGAGQGKQ